MGAREWISIIRPINCAMIGFAVIVGEFVSRPQQIQALQSALGFMTGFFVCAFSMALNDVYDVEVDRVNQPGRPIPSGAVSVQGAARLSAAMLAAGAATALLSLNAVAVAIAAVYSFLSWLYNSWAKREGIWGNMIVASSLAIPFVYGGVIAGGSIYSSLLIMMAMTSFFAGVGREVVKAMADVAGDEKRGVRSLALTRGSRAAAAVGALFFLLAVATSWVPIILGMANTLYIAGVFFPDAIFVYLAASIIRRQDRENALAVKRRALIGMLVGLFVFIGGAL